MIFFFCQNSESNIQSRETTPYGTLIWEEKEVIINADGEIDMFEYSSEWSAMYIRITQ